MYETGYLLEDIAWIMIFLTFFDALMYLINPAHLIGKKSACCMKVNEEGKVMGII